MIFENKDLLRELNEQERQVVLQEQLRSAYSQISSTIVPLGVVAIGVVIIMQSFEPFKYVLIWASIFMLTVVWRTYIIRKFKKSFDKYPYSFWSKQYKIASYAIALVLGMLSFFIYSDGVYFYSYFIIFLLTTIATVASSIMASAFRTSVVFLIFLLSPMVLVLASSGLLELQLVSLLVLVLLAILIGVSNRVNENTTQTIISKYLNNKMLKSIELSEEHFKSIFQDAPVGIFYYDRELRVSEANSEMATIFNLAIDQMRDLDLRLLIDRSLSKALLSVFRGSKGHYEGSYSVAKEELWIVLQTTPIYNNKHEIIGGVGIVNDQTKKKQDEEKIRYQAFYDALTKLPNRALLKDRLEQALSQYRRHGEIFAVMFMDLDHFKSINDTLGHDAGDALLVEIASRIKSCCRDSDTVSRLGGDEFVVILNDLGVDLQGAVQKSQSVADKIHKSITEPIDIGSSTSIETSSSIGISLSTSAHQSGDDLMKYADLAMYLSKKEGRNTTRFYQDKMDDFIQKRLAIAKALRNAISNSELELYYQPFVDMQDSKVVGAEALIRWTNPALGEISPATMIPIAEESGLIVAIGDWVLEQACKQLVQWRTQDFRNGQIDKISVNVSYIQFKQDDFVDKVINTIAKTGIVPSMLELELTESIVIDRVDAVASKMARLRNAGISISMDDFGTGYSSLTYLKKLPFNTLKIDRSFVRDIISDREDAALVETIISIASTFNLSVVAEGVETQEQYDYLRELGCHYFQGYLCSKPVSVLEFENLLAQQEIKCTIL